MTASQSDRPCLFCAIAAGRAPSHRVWEDGEIYAFLDIRPIRPGHVQIVPKAHYDWFEELPPGTASAILHLGQRLAAVHKRVYRVPRVGFLFTGGDVAHAHAHVVPLVAGTDITSRRYIAEETLTFRDTPRVPDAELAATAARLGSMLAG